MLLSLQKLQADIDFSKKRQCKIQGELMLLKSCFSERYPSSPIYLAKNPDSANGGLRWRYSGFHSKHRQRLDFFQARTIMERLPENIQIDWLNFERERIRLNALVEPLMYRIRQLEKAAKHLHQLNLLKDSLSCSEQL